MRAPGWGSTLCRRSCGGAEAAVACGLSGEPLGGPAERPRRGCIDIRIPYTLSRSHDGETLLGPVQVLACTLVPKGGETALSVGPVGEGGVNEGVR